jgi:hypothetical protein
MIQNAEPDTFAGKSSDRIANLEGEISSNLFGGGRRQCPFSDNRASFQENTPFVPYSAVHTGLPPIKNALPNLPSLAAIHPPLAIFRQIDGETWRKPRTVLPSRGK